MAWDNNTNSDWNTLYGGARVPINDTDLPGAPSALGSDKVAWADGSANKAVYDTITLDKPFPEGENYLNAIAGIIDLAHLALYINVDMMYGYKGDARNRVPGDQMSYRGYPTPVINTFNLLTEEANSGIFINFDGSIGVVGTYIVMSHALTLTYKLPYEVTYEVEFTHNGSTKYLVELKIDAGNLTPTQYQLLEIDSVVQEEPDWSALVNGKINFSTDSSVLTNDQTFTVSSIMFSQNNPYYGTTPVQTTIVTETEYNPISGAESLGASTYITTAFDMTHYLNSCSEIPADTLDFYPMKTLYKDESLPIVIGLQLYNDSDLLLPALFGKYLWTYYSYTYGSEIHRITQFIQLDSSGKVEIYYPSMESIGSMYCFIGGSPEFL